MAKKTSSDSKGKRKVEKVMKEHKLPSLVPHFALYFPILFDVNPQENFSLLSNNLPSNCCGISR